ncbi:tricarballylate dehydrogenase [Micromonospora rhizosphaerae]|uniref:Tricarballylate dehydrogenase n=1 Tax=Micromonospora rhizosphaerae TaxID=568872 RepID=A0A1C6SAF1_9ACTN|nr:FAD-dependent tricarballylate dehydrogenase TcuA [Micromonospora rhizosphaerae]SCL26477.1 tricarballylate dehydrogenase [Micromonospora rhizosphaerae]
MTFLETTSVGSAETADHVADVVVVGAGNAALVAALAAHEAGARVLVLEAAPQELRGGNSRFTGGIFRIAHDGLAHLLPLLTDESRGWSEKVSVGPYPAQRYRDEISTTTDGRADSDLVDILVGQSYETVRWMHERGVRWELSVGKLIDPAKLPEGEAYSLPPGGALRAAGEGVGLVEDLFGAVERAGIEVWYDAPVVDLIMDGSSCQGVIVRRPTGDERVYGTVVLASGGFESNPEMRQRWLGPGWDLVKVRGTRFNLGVPLEAALRQGGQPFGHWGGCHAVPLDADAPPVGELKMTDKYSRYSYPYGLMVNAEAQRFVDEGEDEVWLTYAKTGAAVRAQSRAWAAQIFDQRTVHLLEPRYSTGVPVESDTIEGLAEKLNVDPDRLRQTVDAFNAACSDGSIDPFRKDGRAACPAGQPPKSNWAQPLDRPPYVAYTVTCGITFTFGGLRIDTDARVHDLAGRPMPGLYATGEITGGFFYHNYPAGAGLVRGAVFGRIAGEAAARQAAQRRAEAARRG